MKIFIFAKKGLTILSGFASVSSLCCISINNQQCKTRPQVVNVNRDEPVFRPFSIETSKCSASCNNINHLCAKLCVPDVVKNLNVKVFNLMSRTNETRRIEWHETCKCEFKFRANVWNNKQRWNKDKCRCECKELIDKEVVIKDLFRILVIVSVNVIKRVKLEYIQTMKIVIALLIDECTENVEEVKIAKIILAENENNHKCNSCTAYIVLMIVVFTICTGISTYFVYYNRSLVKNNVLHIKFGTRTQTTL